MEDLLERTCTSGVYGIISFLESESKERSLFTLLFLTLGSHWSEFALTRWSLLALPCKWQQLDLFPPAHSKSEIGEGWGRAPEGQVGLAPSMQVQKRPALCLGKAVVLGKSTEAWPGALL